MFFNGFIFLLQYMHRFAAYFQQVSCVSLGFDWVFDFGPEKLSGLSPEAAPWFIIGRIENQT